MRTIEERAQRVANILSGYSKSEWAKRIATEFADLVDPKYEAELDKIRAIVQEKHPVGQMKHIGLMEAHEGVVQILADAEKRLAAVRGYCTRENSALFEKDRFLRDILAILDGKEGT